MEIQAPHLYNAKDKISIFLAGSIEMGRAEQWQKKIINTIQDDNVIFFNPRRDDWNSSWEQRVDNPQFFEQVTWELNHITNSDIVVFYFDPNSISPITLLELGLLLEKNSKICLVCCPEGFYRKGNIDITCSRYGIVVISSLDELIEKIQKVIMEKVNDKL